jgi:mRNA interferase MazF
MFPSISPKQSFPALQVFDEWNEEKKLLSSTDQNDFYVNEREIWYIKLGVNIGSESNGKKDFRRPVLVVKKVWSMFFVVPMTTKGKDSKFYHTIDTAKYISAHHIPEVSRVQLSQVRIADKKRFLHFLWEVSIDDFQVIKKKLQDLLL